MITHQVLPLKMEDDKNVEICVAQTPKQLTPCTKTNLFIAYIIYLFMYIFS